MMVGGGRRDDDVPPVPMRLVSGVVDGRLAYYKPSAGLLCQPVNMRHLQRCHCDWQQPSTVENVDRHVLLIVNPRAGNGSQKELARLLESVTNVLREASVQVSVRYTERRGHVPEIIAEYGLSGLRQYAAVASVGGDGTLQELVVALLSVCAVEGASLDWSAVPPIAVVPAGTGNAIAESMGILSPTHAALNIVHSLRQNNAAPLALMQYRALGAQQAPLVSVGGIQWGFAAEVDQGTENLRWMGDMRLELGALAHIVKRRAVSGRIVVHVHHEKNEQTWAKIEAARSSNKHNAALSIREGLKKNDDGNYVLEGSFMMVVAWNSALIGEGFMVTPHANPTETGVFDLLVVRGDITRIDMLKMLLSSDDGSFLHFTEQCWYFKAHKMVVEQLDGRFLTVDGESVPVEPFEFEIAPQEGKLRILDSFSGSELVL